MKTLLLAATALMTLAAGCAAPEASTDTVAREPEYRTGSNIPRKNKDGANRVETLGKEDLERARTHVPNAPMAQPR